MTMRNEILSREQSASLDFQLMSSPLLSSTKDIGEPELADFLEAFIDSCSFFGLSELYFRYGGRVENSTGDSNVANYYNNLGESFNQKGLNLLTIAIDDFQEYVDGLPTPPSGTADSTNFVSDSKFFYQNLEIKPEDVTKLVDVLDNTVAACSDSAIENYNYILNKANELKTVRERSDRGAVDNIPVWKIVAIAVFLGIAFLDIWRCIIRNKCSKAEKAAYKAGYTIASLVMKFC